MAQHAGGMQVVNLWQHPLQGQPLWYPNGCGMLINAEAIPDDQYLLIITFERILLGSMTFGSQQNKTLITCLAW